MNAFYGHVPAIITIGQLTGIGLCIAGAVYLGVRKLARRYGNPYTLLKRRLMWLYGRPQQLPYIERGIAELEAFANTSAICPCGCGQTIIKSAQDGNG